MVNLTGILLAAEHSTQPVFEKLDPPRRAAVVMALLALILVGMLLVTIALLGGNWVRRLARHKPGKRGPNVDDASAKNERLRASLKEVLPTANAGDTVQLKTSSNETKIN